jgi:Tfp pilus assembly protein PilN
MSTINLLPNDYARARHRRRATVLCLILFVLVISGVLGAHAVSNASLRHAREVLERVNADYAEAAKMITQLRQLEVQENQLRRRAELTASLIERVPRSTLLAIVTQALPPNASLQKLDLQVKHIVGGSGKPSTRFDAARSRIDNPSMGSSVVLEITGMADTDTFVARFMYNLNMNPLFATPQLNYTQEKTIKKWKVREFRIVAPVKPGVDALDFIQARAPRRASAGSSSDARRRI